MSKAVKQLMVKDLSRRLHGVTDMLAGSTVGMTAEDTVAFRAALRAKKVRALVVKNSMCARAFREMDMTCAEPLLDGPTALFYGGESLVDLAKVLIGQARAFAAVKVRGGVTDGALLSLADVQALSNLPSREEIVGMIVGGLLAPVGDVVAALMGPAQQVASQIGEVAERQEKDAA